MPDHRGFKPGIIARKVSLPPDCAAKAERLTRACGDKTKANSRGHLMTHSALASIAEAPVQAVYGGLHLPPLGKFARLDNSEGAQHEHLLIEVEDVDNCWIPAVAYEVAQAALESPPSRAYPNLLREAARRRGLPTDCLSLLKGVEAWR